MKSKLTGIFLLIGLLVWGGCGNAAAPEQDLATVEDWLPLRIGEAALEVQFAVTPAERQQGLMFREELGENRGMLFVFESGEPRGFYMKNTPIPLRIGYFRPDGELREIRRLFPHDLNTVRSRDQDIQFALEVNPEWFRENEIRPGAYLNLEDVRTGLEQRGFAPADFGL
ncbi:MAG: DUF192 domain-containing protein [Opitutales bacterium]|nr:DUF192 domain-containing protein [Opitutales bacterium]MCH8539563.1 DUF192 domain-containing protein [Opitutales bacterium]